MAVFVIAGGLDVGPMLTIMILRWISGRLEFYGTKHLTRRKRESTPFVPATESVGTVPGISLRPFIPIISPTAPSSQDVNWTPPVSSMKGEYLNVGVTDDVSNDDHWADEDQDEDEDDSENIKTDDIIEDEDVTCIPLGE